MLRLKLNGYSVIFPFHFVTLFRYILLLFQTLMKEQLNTLLFLATLHFLQHTKKFFFCENKKRNSEHFFVPLNFHFVSMFPFFFPICYVPNMVVRQQEIISEWMRFEYNLFNMFRQSFTITFLINYFFVSSIKYLFLL